MLLDFFYDNNSNRLLDPTTHQTLTSKAINNSNLKMGNEHSERLRKPFSPIKRVNFVHSKTVTKR